MFYGDLLNQSSLRKTNEIIFIMNSIHKFLMGIACGFSVNKIRDFFPMITERKLRKGYNGYKSEFNETETLLGGW